MLRSEQTKSYTDMYTCTVHTCTPTYISAHQVEVHILIFPIKKTKTIYMPCSFHRSYPAFRRDPELAQTN